jgi:tetratricopeptide (TPR) repeat protein
MLVVEDLSKAIATWQLGIHTYPLDFNNYVNLGIAYGNSGQMEEYLAEFVKAGKVNPPGAVAQLDILGTQFTLDKVLEADATMANDGTNAIEAFRAAMQYPGYPGYRGHP